MRLLRWWRMDGYIRMMDGRGFGILYIFSACGVAMQCDVPSILCPKCVATTGQWHCSLEPGTHTHRRRRDVSTILLSEGKR